MSAGRGTPRVNNVINTLPDVSRVEPAGPASSSLRLNGLASSPYQYTWFPTRAAPLALLQTGVLYTDDDGVDEFPIPLGTTRGSILGTYTGEAGVGGHVGITLLWGTSHTPIYFVVNGFTQSGSSIIVEHFVEEMTFPARTDNTPFAFRIPFWVPTIDDVDDGSLDLETPYIPVQISVKELQGGVTPSSSNVLINSISVENFGQAMPVSVM